MELKHNDIMKMALLEANKAGQMDEVPIGAILVSGSGEILAKAHNQVIRCADPTAHAEILAIRKGSCRISNYRLLNTTLYVTIEPCVMCMGAIIHSRVASVVIGADDPKWGAAGSLYNFVTDPRFNHHPEVIFGVCKNECRSLVQDFFRTRRNTIRKNCNE
jgi:tRNA(adenine34) deaminase